MIHIFPWNMLSEQFCDVSFNSQKCKGDYFIWQSFKVSQWPVSCDTNWYNEISKIRQLKMLWSRKRELGKEKKSNRKKKRRWKHFTYLEMRLDEKFLEFSKITSIDISSIWPVDVSKNFLNFSGSLNCICLWCSTWRWS